MEEYDSIAVSMVSKSVSEVREAAQMSMRPWISSKSRRESCIRYLFMFRVA